MKSKSRSRSRDLNELLGPNHFTTIKLRNSPSGVTSDGEEDWMESRSRNTLSPHASHYESLGGLLSNFERLEEDKNQEDFAWRVNKRSVSFDAWMKKGPAAIDLEDPKLVPQEPPVIWNKRKF